MVRTQVYLAEKQWERVQEMAKDTGLSVAEIIRRALDSYLKEEKQ